MNLTNIDICSPSMCQSYYNKARLTRTSEKELME